MFETISAYQLDWDPITVEGYNQVANEVTMVFNCDITNNVKSENAVHYIIGRTVWCCKNFPSNVKIVLSFDIRGQQIIMTKSNIFKNRILELLNSLRVSNPISVDFLR